MQTAWTESWTGSKHFDIEFLNLPFIFAWYLKKSMLNNQIIKFKKKTDPTTLSIPRPHDLHGSMLSATPLQAPNICLRGLKFCKGNREKKSPKDVFFGEETYVPNKIWTIFC